MFALIYITNKIPDKKQSRPLEPACFLLFIFIIHICFADLPTNIVISYVKQLKKYYTFRLWNILSLVTVFTYL